MYIEITPDNWDNHTLNQVIKTCRQVQKSSDLSLLMLNLVNVPILNSGGVVVLISLKDLLRERMNMDLKLTGLSPENQAILNSSGLSALLQ